MFSILNQINMNVTWREVGLRDTGNLLNLTDDNLKPIWTQYRPYRAYINLYIDLTVFNRYIYSVIHITCDLFGFFEVFLIHPLTLKDVNAKKNNPKNQNGSRVMWIRLYLRHIILHVYFLLIFVGWIFFELSFLFLKWIWFWMSFLVWILVSVLNQNLINIDKPLLGSG